MRTKQCKECAKLGQGPKPLTEFNKNRTQKDGLQDKCRDHTRAYCRDWVKNNPEKNRSKGKRFRQQNPSAYRNIQVRTHLKQTYNLSEVDYRNLFERQEGFCAICEIPMVNRLDEFNGGRQGFAPNEFARVDHDHATGEVRGLLCFSCNVGLGKFQDDETILLNAVRYLRDSRNRTAESRTNHETVRGKDEPQVAGPQSSSRSLKDDHWLN